jgi:hypothetical protein
MEVVPQADHFRGLARGQHLDIAQRHRLAGSLGAGGVPNPSAPLCEYLIHWAMMQASLVCLPNRLPLSGSAGRELSFGQIKQ